MLSHDHNMLILGSWCLALTVLIVQYFQRVTEVIKLNIQTSSDKEQENIPENYPYK